MTTIKVPVELRDRLAARAKRDQRTLAQVIAAVIDEAEDGAFWMAVSRAHAEMTEEERQAALHDPVIRDGLHDELDMEISRNDAW